MSTKKYLLQTSKALGENRSIVRRFAKRWERWSINFDTRKQLLKLDQHELDDIGMTREFALKEGSKPFWKD